MPLNPGTLKDINLDNLIENQIAMGYNWVNSPTQGIAVVEVYKYSPDWVLQIFRPIGSVSSSYQRSYYSGKEWGKWYKVQMDIS